MRSLRSRPSSGRESGSRTLKVAPLPRPGLWAATSSG
jgi:hypothetical protein